MWDYLSIELQDMIISYLNTRQFCGYKVGLVTDWCTYLSPSISNYELVGVPPCTGFQSDHVILPGFITHGKFAFKFDDLKGILSKEMYNNIHMSKDSTTFCIDFHFKKEVRGIVTNRKVYSNPLYGVSKRFSYDLLVTDCLLELETELEEECDYLGTDALFLSVEIAKPRMVEVVVYCRKNSTGEASPVFKSICVRVEVENGHERFYCGLAAFGKLIWCREEEDVLRWNSNWGLIFLLNEDSQITVNKATHDGSWTVVGAIEKNEVWIRMGETELWGPNENDGGCDFVCEIRGSAARKWWRILRTTIKICKMLSSSTIH